MIRLIKCNDPPSAPPRYKYITKYYIAKGIGVRATQISQGYPPVVHIKNETCPRRLAELELQQHKIPIVWRSYVNGVAEDWTIDKIQHVYKDLPPKSIIKL